MTDKSVFEAESPLDQLKLFSSAFVANFHKKPHERNWEKVSVKWDTGATICFISRNLANRLDLHPECSMPVSSFSGVGDCLYDVVAISLMQGGDCLIVLAAIVDDFPHSDCDMLIGMNLISQGDLYIAADFESMKLRLTFKPYPGVMQLRNSDSIKF